MEKKILSLRWLLGHCKQLHSFSKGRSSQKHNSKAKAHLPSLPPTIFLPMQFMFNKFPLNY